MTIQRVLIANRGAIAVRIIRTLKKLGLESITVYAEADRESLHVHQADHSFSLGNGGATDTYLNQEKIIKIAKEAGAQAIHPGYGFLSENTEFVTLCEANSITFLGPRVEHMAAFGLKHEARKLAEASKVPLLPGSNIVNDTAEAIIAANNIGYPVMLKSTAGGGGIGMQLCRTEQELVNSWSGVAKLSANNFSNADLFIEKFVERARHIEVQIFGDGTGNTIAIGERDCSAQRRNQKVLEETPAPDLSDDVRAKLQEVAIALTESIQYQSAGTVEFILDADTQDFYFLEVNTRLQVEHGVTEQVYGVDIVQWMIELASGTLDDLSLLKQRLQPCGHSIQARVYAEDPSRGFRPSSGLLTEVALPSNLPNVRIDTWVEAGIEVTHFFDPMLAKIISYAPNRLQALNTLSDALQRSKIYGIETNLNYVTQLLEHAPLAQGRCLTNTLVDFKHQTKSIEVLSPGTMTTIQDYPGRIGYWDIGVPPSGPFDDRSFRIGNRLLGNTEGAAGLEITMNGPHLTFTCSSKIALTGAGIDATLDGHAIEMWSIIEVKAGQTLKIGKVRSGGMRSYLLFAGGLQCPDYLGSKSTFTLGQFGGHCGRALRTGDVLHISNNTQQNSPSSEAKIDWPLLGQASGSIWEIRVIAGPQTAPDYFTKDYIDQFFQADWEVHYNSSRTGVRLMGPKPEWARKDGGEAGMHPSNIHDNAYAIGAIDFTGDMPVILGPDGPSLGGFVCPATVISADLWKVGQLAAGDCLKFVAVEADFAVDVLAKQHKEIDELSPSIETENQTIRPQVTPRNYQETSIKTSIVETPLKLSQSGDANLLIEYGEPVLDIELRFQVHRLMQKLEHKQQQQDLGLLELTPGIRSLQVHYDCLRLSFSELVDHVLEAANEVAHDTTHSVPSRVVHLPLSWDDTQCRIAVEKYHQSVRQNAPWHPSNIEFIRRINGLESIDDVKRIVFDANYLVMGLGDVYLGAPVATPVDPRHRLVTTKYNPARTWTAENSVGIGGSYLCIYGMEGPGGYQFVGRTLQMWNRYRKTPEFSQPWLLRFFDQIKFHPVSEAELLDIRRDFPLGHYPLKIEETEFNLTQYRQSLINQAAQISTFTKQREQAFEQELADWKESGQFHFEETTVSEETDSQTIPEGMISVDSPVTGNVWQLNKQVGDSVSEGESLLILESMKMEIDVLAPCNGVLHKQLRDVGSQATSGLPLAIIDPN